MNTINKEITNRLVCILTSTHSPFDTRIFHKEARSLQLAGYRVVIIAPYHENDQRDDIQILGIKPPRNRLARIVILPFRLLKAALQQSAGLYHFHDPDLLLTAFLIKRLTRAKLVYDVHENYTEVIKSRPWLPGFSRPLLSKVFSTYEKMIARRLDGAIAVTEEIEDLFDAPASVIVRNYPRIEQFDRQRDRIDPKNLIKLIYVGDLTRVRGIIEIVKALEYIEYENRVELTLVGGFSEKKLANTLKSMEGYTKVKHLGRIPYNELSYHLHNADIGLVCLHPLSRYIKALPVKMFEYMAAGLPVIASDFPAWKSILEEYKCGLVVDPESPEAIAEAICFFLDNPDQRSLMGKNGKRAVMEKYNWSGEAERLLRFYNDILQA